MSFQIVSPVLVVPPVTLTTGCSLYSGGDTPPLLSLALPVDILLSFNDFFFFFQFSSFPKAETLDHHLSFTKHVKSVLHINKCHAV